MASWAEGAIKSLAAGLTTSVRLGRRKDSPTEILYPLSGLPRVDEKVLVRVHGRVYLAVIAEVKRDHVRLVTESGYRPGWAPFSDVFGKTNSAS